MNRNYGTRPKELRHLDPSHYMGIRCGVCLAVLETDDCCPADRHGYRLQKLNDYARRHYPKHSCFQPPERVLPRYVFRGKKR